MLAPVSAHCSSWAPLPDRRAWLPCARVWPGIGCVLHAPDEFSRRQARSCTWGRNGLWLTCCCGLTWFLLAFVGTHCHATCACSLARLLLAYAGSRRRATLPTGMWLDLEPFQHRYLGIRLRRRSPITSVVSGTVCPPLFPPVALRGQPSLTVGHGSHVHKCPCRWLGRRAPDESNRRHGRSCMWGRNGLGAAFVLLVA